MTELDQFMYDNKFMYVRIVMNAFSKFLGMHYFEILEEGLPLPLLHDIFPRWIEEYLEEYEHIIDRNFEPKVFRQSDVKHLYALNKTKAAISELPQVVSISLETLNFSSKLQYYTAQNYWHGF